MAGGGGDGAGGGGGIGVWPSSTLVASLRHELYRPNGLDLVVWPYFEIGLKVYGPWQTGNVTKSQPSGLYEYCGVYAVSFLFLVVKSSALFPNSIL